METENNKNKLPNPMPSVQKKRNWIRTIKQTTTDM